jgi:hypothetical protein
MPKGHRTLLGKVYKQKRWAKRFAKMSKHKYKVREVKRGWKIVR